jgi:hypothetical protein
MMHTAVRDRLAGGKPINNPVAEDDCFWEVSLQTPGCGGGALFLGRKEVDRYNADPDGYAATHFGFATSDEYREWVSIDGAALCSERTRSSEMCRNAISRIQLHSDEWRRRHRLAPCSIHGGQPDE